MRVLLVESTPGSASAVRTWLQDAGHETASCFEAPVSFGCKGSIRHEECVLDRHTDVAVVVRDLDRGPHTLTEMGAVCAMRHRVPVVELMEPGSTNLDAALLAALSQAESASATRGYVDAVRESLAKVTTLVGADRIGIEVTRASGRVHAMLELPGDLPEQQVAMVVDWAGRALRAHDQYAKVIDIGVRRP